MGAALKTSPHAYEVGYRKPPVHSRFKPGQSGNPKGRRRQAKAPKALLEEALSGPITITEGGVTRTIELRLALFKSMVAKAIKGDTRAAALVIKLMEQFGPDDVKDEAARSLVVRFVRPDEVGSCDPNLPKR